jgi:hypothetical protein
MSVGPEAIEASHVLNGWHRPVGGKGSDQSPSTVMVRPGSATDAHNPVVSDFAS